MGNDNSEDKNLPNYKYQDISYFTNHITKGMKSKALSLFHLNFGSLPKQFDNFKYLINQLQIEFEFIGITESRLIKGISPTANINLKDYFIEDTPTESSAGGALLYVNKKYLYIPEIISIFINQVNIIIGDVYRNQSMDICTFNDHCLNPLLEKLLEKIDKKIFISDFNIDLLKYDSSTYK